MDVLRSEIFEEAVEVVVVGGEEGGVDLEGCAEDLDGGMCHCWKMTEMGKLKGQKKWMAFSVVIQSSRLI